MATLIERFRTYPPAVQWLLILLAVLAAVLLWHDLVWKRAVAWSQRADEYQTEIAASESITTALPRTTQEAILALGDVDHLEPRSAGSQQFSEAMNEVLKPFDDSGRVEGLEVEEKSAVAFKSSELPPGVVPENMAAERLIADIRFEAGQDVAFEVIAALEQHPKIDTVSTVRMTRAQDPRKKTVVVQMQAQAWVLTTGGPATGRAGG